MLANPKTTTIAKNGATLLFVFLATLSFAQNWTTVSITDRIKVDLPKEPKTTNANGIIVYEVEEHDYILSIQLMESTRHVTKENCSKALDDFVQRMTGAGNPQHLPIRKIIQGGVEGREIIFNQDLPGRKNVSVIHYFFYADNKMLGFSLKDLSGKTPERIRQKFFNSIVIPLLK